MTQIINLTERQQQLLEWLQTQPAVSIQEIEASFGVSRPTAYRDIRAVIETGRAIKTSSGIKLAQPDQGERRDRKCAFCGGAVNERATFVIQMQDGTARSACCPHCGLMALDQPGVQSALASDFLYGRMVNARQATFLLKSTVFICCEPSVLCFANADEAQRFQSGFGGEICTLEIAKARVAEIMALPDPSHEAGADPGA